MSRRVAARPVVILIRVTWAATAACSFIDSLRSFAFSGKSERASFVVLQRQEPTVNMPASLPPSQTAEYDVFADPLSSSEDDGRVLARQGSKSPVRSTERPSIKRPLPESKLRTRKRLRLDSPLAVVTVEEAPRDPSVDMFTMTMGSSSQLKKRRPVYGSQSNTRTTLQDQIPSLPITKPRKQMTNNTSVPSMDDLPKPTQPSQLLVSRMTDVLEREAVVEPFKAVPEMPEEILLGYGSASTATSNTSLVLDIFDSPSARMTINSTDSLDGVPIAAVAFQLPEEYKLPQKDMEESADPNQDAKCPLCSCPVKLTLLEEFNYGRRMNFRAQERFCQTHKRLDAIDAFKDRGYPVDVDWQHLETVRIPKHVRRLTRVLTRKTPSHYRTQLEQAAAAINARAGLQTYLKKGFEEVVNAGYYGPKGQRIFTDAVTSLMSKPLKEALRRDKIVRSAEVGGYVSTVLVPELTLRLVMEDQGLSDDKVMAGLQILEESTQAGMEMWAQDEDYSITRTKSDEAAA